MENDASVGNVLAANMKPHCNGKSNDAAFSSPLVDVSYLVAQAVSTSLSLQVLMLIFNSRDKAIYPKATHAIHPGESTKRAMLPGR